MPFTDLLLAPPLDLFGTWHVWLRMIEKTTVSCAFFAAALVVPWLLGGTVANADDCSGQSINVIAHSRASLEVEVSYDSASRKWSGVIRRPDGSSVTMTLDEYDSHAHLDILVSSRGDRFAILDSHADHSDENRLIVFDQDGNRVRRYALTDLLPPSERVQVSQSISHIRWLAPNGVRLSRDGRSIQFRTRWGYETSVVF